MLRFSEERYDAELRFHRDMNLNLIRIWGGAIIERPEFYQACDKYGLLVFQDFGFSGDCNGRWRDPKKKDDQWTRRTYPDNHKLFMQTAVDQIKLIRNHPSLAFWCGGNEITPPDDILFPLRDSILPALDGTRYFFDYSNSDSMSLNTLGGNGDGPYSIQDIKTFFSKRSYPFNSEIGSVGVGDYESLQKFIPPEHLLPMGTRGNKIDSVWNYHKYLPYGHYMDAYGAVKDLKDFAMKAQLLNYDQYRALIEGFSAHMWDWYTGTIIWKTQNPWTALRGQMYDCYLDVNACLFGLRKGSQPLHIAFNPSDSTILLINNGFTKHHNLMIEVKTYDIISGRENFVASFFNEIGPSMSLKTSAIAGHLKSLKDQGGVFLLLKLLKQDKSLASENFYWLPGADGNFTALQKMPKASLRLSARRAGNNRVIISLFNDKTNPVAFFNRIALLNKETGGRLLPVFFSDNYVSILPGETKVVEASYPQQFTSSKMSVQLYGWNVEEKILDVH